METGLGRERYATTPLNMQIAEGSVTFNDSNKLLRLDSIMASFSTWLIFNPEMSFQTVFMLSSPPGDRMNHTLSLHLSSMKNRYYNRNTKSTCIVKYVSITK